MSENRSHVASKPALSINKPPIAVGIPPRQQGGHTSHTEVNPIIHAEAKTQSYPRNEDE